LWSPCEADRAACEHGVPFGFAEGRLSTAVVLRLCFASAKRASALDDKAQW
jgi:hypothetical protein